MLVCLCKAVNDKKIRQCIHKGAQNVKDIMSSCQAGSDCGACISTVKELLDEETGRNLTKKQSRSTD